MSQTAALNIPLACSLLPRSPTPTYPPTFMIFSVTRSAEIMTSGTPLPGRVEAPTIYSPRTCTAGHVRHVHHATG